MRTEDIPIAAQIDETSGEDLVKIDRLTDFAIGASDIKKYVEPYFIYLIY